MALNLPSGVNEHYGRNVDTMSKLLEADEVPTSAARFMQLRSQEGREFPDLWTHYTDTSDLIVYPQGDSNDVYVLLTVDNQGKITPNGRKALELIRPDNLASNYGAVVEQLDELEGDGLIKVPRNRITTETYLPKDKALGELTWRILARDPDEVPECFAEDKSLLGKYFDKVASKTGQSENMALYVAGSLDDKTTLKAWCVNWAARVCRSLAGGRGDLVSDGGRFLGLAPEVLVAQNFQDSLLDKANGQFAKLEQMVDAKHLAEIRRVLDRPVVSVEQVLKASTKYVPEVAQEGFESDVRALYENDQ